MYNRDRRTKNTKEDKKMEIGNLVFAEHKNGKMYSGEVVRIKKMQGYRLWFVVKTDDGYKSLYLDECVTCDYLGHVNA